MVVVDLPLGATEDRVVGSLDVEKAIKLGVEALEPGILAESNQNILYVDEINLLPDHIADDLLDAAGTGWNVVEREGISVSHPSRFIFTGTMNPEEGELRPQLLDRFPLSVGVERIGSVKQRMEIVKRNIQFEKEPESFLEKYEPIQQELRNKIIQAREVLPNVDMSEELLETICKACLELKVDGMRPDIVISKAASTLAAFENRTEITLNDVLVASELALSHRTREGGFLEPATPEEIQRTFSEKAKEIGYEKSEEEQKEEKSKQKGKAKKRGVFWLRKTSKREEEGLKRVSRVLAELSKLLSWFRRFMFGIAKRMRHKIEKTPHIEGVIKSAPVLNGGSSAKEGKLEIAKIKCIPSVKHALRTIQVEKGIPFLSEIKEKALSPFKLFFKKSIRVDKKVRSHAGKRAETVTALHRGRPRGWKFPRGKPADIHLPATIRAAARRQKTRETTAETALKIGLEDVREKLRLYKAPVTLVFLIDLSGSMILSIDSVTKALLKLHGDAYRYRDQVGIVALKETSAIVVQHPITNLRVVANKLLKLRISGFTPLASGMLKALEVLKEAKRRDRSTIPVMVILTDGNTNVPLSRSLQTGEVRHFDVIGIAYRKYVDLAVEDVINVSEMIKREGIYTVVVNTNPYSYGEAETRGYVVTKLISSITKGRLHIVGKTFKKPEIVEKIADRIAEDQRIIAHEASLNTQRNW